MKAYKIPNVKNQEFIIDYNGEKLTLAMRYIPLNKGIYVSIAGVVHGVKMSLDIPFLTAYGYPNLYFVSYSTGNDVINGDEQLYAVVFEDAELEDYVMPVIVADEMGIEVY